jgi:hypothetical protein
LLLAGPAVVYELLGGLCVLTVILVLVTLIGHGLWVACAALFGGQPRHRPPAPSWVRRSDLEREPCVCCGLKLPTDLRDCPRCGLDRDGATAAELADLEATARQLERFRKREDLPAAEIDRLWEQVQDRRERLVGSPPRERAVPVPPAEPIEPGAEAIAELPEVLPLRPVAPPRPAEVEQLAGEEIGGQETGVGKEEAEAGKVMPVPSIAAEILPVPVPRRSWTETLAGFMEDKNILWGELVGGLLIVGGSIALVISLWNTLQENPYFPFGIFAAVTAALFGAGLYTLHHWKLESTSRGLLVIATLLVPLCFTVLPSMLEETAADLRELAIAAGGLAVFAFLIYQAGRVLVPGTGVLLPLAILGCLSGQLLGARLLGTGQAEPVLAVLLACLPAASHALGVGLASWRLRPRGPTTGALAWPRLALAGLAAFALALALGTLVFRSGDPGLALGYLSPLVSVSVVPLLALGLGIHRGLESVSDEGGLRTTATAVALAAVTAMLAAVGLAWPLVWLLLAVCALNFAVLSFAAFRSRIPAIHAAALACLALGFLLLFHLGEGLSRQDGSRLWLRLCSAAAGTRLAFLALACAGAGELLARLGRQHDALAYTVGAGAIGLAGLGLVTGHGLDLPGHAALVYGVYALAGLTVNLRWRRAWVSYVCLALGCGATLWVLYWGWPGRLPLWSAVLAAEAFALASLALLAVPEALRSAYRLPLARIGEGIGGLAILLAVASGFTESWRPEFVVAGLGLLGLYLVLTALTGRVEMARTAGVMLLGTVAATAGWLGIAWQAPDLGALLGVSFAMTSTILAAVTLARRPGQAPGTPAAGSAVVFTVLIAAWRETTALAAGLALVVALAGSSPGSRLHTGTAFSLAATAWLLTWRYRSVVLAWTASALLLVGLAHLLHWAAVLTTERLATTALLLHANLVLLASLILRAVWQQPEQAAVARRILTRPLALAALVSTCLALPLPLFLDQGPFDARSLSLAWLSALWLVLAWTETSRWLFAAFQAVLCVAVGFAMTAWLQQQPWVLENSRLGLLDPRSLQSYGLALSGLCLAAVVARLGLRGSQTGRRLLLPDWPGVDRMLLGGLLLGQMALADWAVVPGILRELAPGRFLELLDNWPAVHDQAYGAGAWFVLAALTVVVIAGLWQPPPRRRQMEAVLGLVVLAATAPVLWAGPSAVARATASALRWGLAVSFLISSALLWLRGPLASAAGRLGMPTDGGAGVARYARHSLVDLTLVPVLLLTAVTAGLVLAGTPPARPEAASFFGQFRLLVSLLIPLGLATLALSGHALRERSAEYAFSAGLVLLMIVGGGYAVGIVRSGGVLAAPEWARLVQLGTITAAGWLLLWLGGRRLLPATQEGWLARPLLTLQAGLLSAGNGVLLVGGVGILVITTLDPLGPAPWHAGVLAWTTAVGSAWGWLALGLAAVATWAWRARSFWRAWPGIFGFATVALVACSAERFFPGWGYRALMLGWAAYGLIWAAMPPGQPAEGVAAPSWVLRTGALVVLLGIGAAAVRGDHLWAAGAIGVVGIAGFLLALRWRRGDWVLIAGPAFNLAASFVLWHLYAGSAVDWWVPLCQVNALVGSVLALVLLALERRLEGPMIAGRRLSLLEALQVGMVRRLDGQLRWELQALQAGFWALVNLIPPLAALAYLYLFPQASAAEFVHQVSGPLGWLALALASGAATWHVSRTRLAGFVHVLAGTGVLAAILLAASLQNGRQDGWPAYHMLLALLTALAAALLAVGWTASGVGLLGPASWPAARRASAAQQLRAMFPAPGTLRWVEALGIVLVGLAVRGTLADPSAPFWPAGIVLAVSLLAGGLAFWSRRFRYVPVSGSLLFLAGIQAWTAWGHGRLDNFLYAAILCLGSASAIWSVLEVRLGRQRGPGPSSARRGEARAWSIGSAVVLLTLVLLGVLLGPPALSLWTRNPYPLEWLAIQSLPAAFLFFVLINQLSRRAEQPDSPEAVPAAEVAGEQAWLLPFSQVAGLLGLGLLAVLIALGLGADLTATGLYLASPLAWAAWGATLLGAVAHLWDPLGLSRGLRALPLYLLAALGLGLGLHGLALEPARLCWALTLNLAGLVLVTMLVAWMVPRLPGLWQTLRLPARSAPGPEGWLLPVQAVVSGLAAALSVWVSFAFAERLDRLAGPLAVALVVPAWVLMTRLSAQGLIAQPRLLGALRTATLLLGALALADLAWALPAPGEAGTWLHRNVLLFTALALSAAGSALGLRRLAPRQEAWAESGQRLGPRLGLAGVLVVLVVLAQEMLHYDPATRAAPLAPWALALVVLTLAGLAAAAIAFAVQPRLDPLALSDRRRPLYVYAAELVLVLLFLHARLTMPFLFSGMLARYWTLVVMALAFLGVGLAEWFARRNLPVLAGPLQRTGVFLPLLPLLAFWLQGLAGPLSAAAGEQLPGLQPLLNDLRNLPRDYSRHALVWLLLGVLYALVAWSRRSPRFALLAALAGNFGLWAGLYHFREHGLAFYLHPQLWLIPLAVILLVAEHLNRDRLPAAQAAGLRYLGLILLYLSSTADLFIAGLGDVGLSLVLAVLAVLGVLAGIQLRVRAFLFVGLTFLVLVLFARIWHAAVTQAQTWVWWVCLIVLGAAILALFAVFEKRRNEVLKLLEELKRWK